MRIKDHYFFYLACISVLFACGCVSTPSFKIKNSLPQSKLAYFNDPFDKLRTDVWDKAGLTFNEQQLANFKPADMRIEDGKLRIETKIGHFSKGGLLSRYTFRGDFDIQLDCQMDFLDMTLGMDQVLFFMAKEATESNWVMIGLSKPAGKTRSFAFSQYLREGKRILKSRHQIGNFKGALRIVRIAGKIRTQYRSNGEPGWTEILSFSALSGDVVIGFGLQNFTGRRNGIDAESSIAAKFESFRINNAQEIIEEEI
ncbi:MAG: hypothetical protein SV375_02950 [Thermodesulfobacteriota bacterium]|nr:hypothetical protein [Thermodesulfobacteriota bacterium]